MIKLFLNTKLDLILTVKFVKQLFRIKIKKGGKVLLWNQVKSRMKACYSELVLDNDITGNLILTSLVSSCCICSSLHLVSIAVSKVWALCEPGLLGK